LLRNGVRLPKREDAGSAKKRLGGAPRRKRQRRRRPEMPPADNDRTLAGGATMRSATGAASLSFPV
jgi:hypothetical protein